MADFGKHNAARNAVWLWQTIQRVYHRGAEVSQDIDTANALARFTSIVKRKFESIHDFYKRFQEEYIAYVAAGGPELAESVRVAIFNNGIGSTHAGYVASVRNDASRGIRAPETLESNYIAASKFVTAESGKDGGAAGAAAVYYTGDQIHARGKQRKKGGDAGAASSSTEKQSKGKKKSYEKKKISCYACGGPHKVSECPEVATGEADNSAGETKVNAAVVPVVAAAGRVPARFLVGMDSGAYTSVFNNPDLLTDVEDASCEPLLDWHGAKMQNQARGNFHPFGCAELNIHTPINLLSEYEIKSRYDFTEIPLDSLVVHTPERDIHFWMDHDRHMYVTDWRKYTGAFDSSAAPLRGVGLVSTVRQNEAMYSAREVKAAREAVKKIANAGYMSKEAVLRLASSSGNVINLNLNRADVLRAIEIYGEEHVLQGRSRLVKPDTRVVTAAPTPKQPQRIFTDVFYVGGCAFLLGVVKPLGLLLCKPMAGETESDYGLAFEEFVNVLRAHGFLTEIIYSDADQAVVSVMNQLGPVRVEVSGAGDHVTDVENAIKTVKERIRSVKSSLVFRLNKFLVTELVLYVVGRVNITVPAGAADGLCARVRFTGDLVDASKDLCLGFGAYVLARNKNVKSNDALELRNDACIALRPLGNRQGSWRMLKLATGRVVSRTQFTEQPLSDLVIHAIDEITHASGGSSLTFSDDEDYADLLASEDSDPPDVAGHSAVPVPDIHYVPGFSFVEPTVGVDSRGDMEPAGHEPEDDENMEPAGHEPEDDENNEAPPAEDAADEGPEEVPLRPASRYTEANRARWDRGAKNYPRVGNFHISPKKGYAKYGKESFRAQMKELKTLHENGTFEGILPDKLSNTQRKKIIRSIMFLKEKFTAEGVFEKIRARLVANGSQMDRETLLDVSSPTPSLMALFVVSVLAAREGREIAVMDVGSAFVKASMDGEEEVLVALDQLSAALLVKIDPTYAQYLDRKGEMTVKLKKALYGCVQAAKLWHDLLVSELKKLGYIQNPEEPCVLNRTVKGKQSTLIVHVDDIKILSMIAGEVTRVHDALKRKFGEVSLKQGLRHNYLGMTFDYSVPGKVSISMLGYERDMVDEWDTVGAKANTPAQNDVFEKGESENLSANRAKLYHSFVMKVAYLAKRAKPELSVGTSYMMSQVTAPNEADWAKLDRSVRYIRDNIGSGIVLEAAGSGKEVMIDGYIDAAFGCHVDGKSHTGVCVTLGQGPVYVRSTKQKIVTKSSTEAELVGLSDEAGTVLSIADFVALQGYTPSTRLRQDNMGTIAMIGNGRSKSLRTKHIKVRYFWLREQLKDNLRIEYTPTGKMIADILTKPMQGALFQRFVKLLCNRGNVARIT
jgi:hypothetical protein